MCVCNVLWISGFDDFCVFAEAWTCACLRIFLVFSFSAFLRICDFVDFQIFRFWASLRIFVVFMFSSFLDFPVFCVCNLIGISWMLRFSHTTISGDSLDCETSQISEFALSPEFKDFEINPFVDPPLSGVGDD